MPAMNIDIPEETHRAITELAAAHGRSAETEVRAILERAAWTGITVEPLDAPVSVTRQEAMDLLLGVGPMGAAVRADPALKPKLTEAVTGALEPYRDGDRLEVTAACWLVTANA